MPQNKFNVIVIIFFIVVVSSVVDSQTISGPKRTIVLLVNFNDTNSSSPSISEVNNTVFGDISLYYRYNSYSNTWLIGEVSGWYTINMSSYFACTFTNDTLYKAIEVADPYINFTNYEQIVILHPKGISSGCSWQGRATAGKVLTQTADGSINVSVAWVFSNAFIDKPEILVHELGHNFGAWHAGRLVCNDNPVGIIGPENCNVWEYGDPMDIMGYGGFNNMPNMRVHMNAATKEKLGWLPNYSIQTTNAGVYLLEPLSSNTSGIRAIKVPIPGKSYYYYIEYRQPINFDDAWVGYPINVDYYNAALIHIAPYSGGYYVDSVIVDVKNNQDPYNMSLGVGESFLDYINGINITILNKTEKGITVNVGNIGEYIKPLYLKVSLFPDGISSEYSSNVSVHVTTIGNIPVDSASVSVSATCGILNPIDGYTNTSGDFKSNYIAPVVSTTTKCNISATVSKSDYINGSGYGEIKIYPLDGCSVKGDTPPCDGKISDFELLDYIEEWAKNMVSDFDLLEAIDNWTKG